MMIGPEDLHEVRFQRELRGYCPEEVDGFLDQVVFVWRTGGRPDTLLASLSEPRFSTTVRGYRRSDVDRVIAQITCDWRRTLPPEAELATHLPVPEPSAQRSIDTPEERAMSVSEPFDVHEHPKTPAASLDRSDLPSIDHNNAASVPAQPLPSEMPMTRQAAPAAIADHAAADLRTSDRRPLAADRETLPTGDEPRTATVDPADDVRLPPPPPIIEQAVDEVTLEGTPRTETASSALLEEELATCGAEPPQTDAAELLLRTADETRLHLLDVLENAAADLRRTSDRLLTRYDVRSAGLIVDQEDPQQPTNDQPEPSARNLKKTKNHKKKKKKKKKNHRPTD
jgi:DivIVA domain-containing protein